MKVIKAIDREAATKLNDEFCMLKPIYFLLICLITVACSSKEKQHKNTTKKDKQPQEVVEENAVEDSIDWKDLSDFEYYLSNLPEGVELETKSFSWPGDDFFCDQYDGSDGPLDVTLVRIKESGKIIYWHESGSYCQGDSEYWESYTFDQYGNAVRSYFGSIGTSDVQTFYKNGKAVLEVEFPGFVETYHEENNAPIYSKVESHEKITVVDFENRIEELKETVQERIAGLEAFEIDAEDERSLQERDTLLKQLKETLNTEVQFESISGKFQYPNEVYEEGNYVSIQLNKRKVNVYASPSMDSEVVATYSYFDPMLMISELGPEETIAPHGKNVWYKIMKSENNGDGPYEGWVYGAFVAKDIY